MHTLETLGWNDFFAGEYARCDTAKYRPGRVMSEYQGCYGIATSEGEFLGETTGKLRHRAQSRAELPVVGDWVLVVPMPGSDRLVIERVLPRKSRFSRREPGKEGAEQVIAANVDTVFIVQGLDSNYNLRRLERILVMVWASGARPVAILNKADLCPEVAVQLREAELSSPGVPVHAISSVDRAGYEHLSPYLSPGKTVAFIGSSGVGKSTIINNLLGRDAQRTKEVREKDSRGRHTTTNRQIFVMPGCALLLDTPGMRELQLWDAAEGLGDTFQDILDLTASCRFANCSHRNEPGCAVLEAVAEGKLSAERLESHRKLKKELNYTAAKHDRELKLQRKAREKNMSRDLKKTIGHKTRGGGS